MRFCSIRNFFFFLIFSCFKHHRATCPIYPYYNNLSPFFLPFLSLSHAHTHTLPSFIYFLNFFVLVKKKNPFTQSYFFPFYIFNLLSEQFNIILHASQPMEDQVSYHFATVKQSRQHRQKMYYPFFFLFFLIFNNLLVIVTRISLLKTYNKKIIWRDSLL